MRKLIYVLISLVIFSCAKEDDVIDNLESIAADQEINQKNSAPVSLVKAWSTSGSYRGYISYFRRFTVKVTDLAFDKKVSIFHEKVDGSWEEIPLSYSFDIDDQNEIWSGSYNQVGYGISPEYANQFVVKYEVNGNTYWDNNNGSNYAVSSNAGMLIADPGANISADEFSDSLFFSPSFDQNQLNFVVDVKNLAPNKEVGVVYTTDGWQTQEYLSLSYNRVWRLGPLVAVQSPNDLGVERWSGITRIDKSISKVEYAVVYYVNGQEYWDNNYGRNFIVEKN